MLDVGSKKSSPIESEEKRRFSSFGGLTEKKFSGFVEKKSSDALGEKSSSEDGEEKKSSPKKESVAMAWGSERGGMVSLEGEGGKRETKSSFRESNGALVSSEGLILSAISSGVTVLFDSFRGRASSGVVDVVVFVMVSGVVDVVVFVAVSGVVDVVVFVMVSGVVDVVVFVMVSGVVGVVVFVMVSGVVDVVVFVMVSGVVDVVVFVMVSGVVDVVVFVFADVSGVFVGESFVSARGADSW